MEINRYFIEEMDHPIPRRVFARSIEYQPGSYEHFDAIDADYLEKSAADAPGLFHPSNYGDFVQTAPIYSVEVRASPVTDGIFEYPWGITSDVWLDRYPARPDWLELYLEEDPDGPAEVFMSAESLGRRARIEARAVTPILANALDRATRLSRFHASDTEIEDALPSGVIDGVIILDVGQGSSAALINDMEEVICYVDVGAGTRNDKGTWPQAMGPFCVQQRPSIVLSHWHEDHFQGANKTPALQGLTWIAPDQKLGPGPQTAMASAIGSSGTLLIWPRQGTLRRGQLTLERCIGNNQNRSGIAVWVDHFDVNAASKCEDPILVPGDAGYLDIPGLTGRKPRQVHSFAVAHHGGQAVGRPPTRPNNPDARAAMSFGPANQYGHPLPRSLAGLRASSWSIGYPHHPTDDRRTEDRNAIGWQAPNLGHIGLDWGQQKLTVSCTCGCTLTPTQF